MDRHLLVFFALLAITGVAVSLPRGERDPFGKARLERLPLKMGGWAATREVSEEILPGDPRAFETVRRTYTDGDRKVWVVVGRYPSRNHPQGRPSLDRIVPENRASAVAHDFVQVDLNGVPGRVTLVNRVSVQQPGGQLSVIYWYQLREQVIAGEYRLRFRLFLDTLLGRQRLLVLVRIATDSREPPEAFLRAFYPQLLDLLSS